MEDAILLQLELDAPRYSEFIDKTAIDGIPKGFSRGHRDHPTLTQLAHNSIDIGLGIDLQMDSIVGAHNQR